MADPKTLHVTVTKEDLQEGFKCDPALCPVALAIRRASDCYDVAVTRCIRIDDELWPTPPRVWRFIKRYDWGWHFWPFIRPFSFDLPGFMDVSNG